MFEKINQSATITAADQQLAAEYAMRGVADRIVSPVVTADDLAAGVLNRGDVVVGNGASIRIATAEPVRSLQVGSGDPAAFAHETAMDGIDRLAAHHVEQLNALTDPDTGGPRAGYELDYNRYALMLRQQQISQAYDTAMLAERRRAAAVDRSSGIGQLQAEAEWQERRTQDALSRELEAQFGRVRIV